MLTESVAPGSRQDAASTQSVRIPVTVIYSTLYPSYHLPYSYPVFYLFVSCHIFHLSKQRRRSSRSPAPSQAFVTVEALCDISYCPVRRLGQRACPREQPLAIGLHFILTEYMRSVILGVRLVSQSVRLRKQLFLFIVTTVLQMSGGTGLHLASMNLCATFPYNTNETFFRYH